MPKLGAPKKNRNDPTVIGPGGHLIEVRQSSYLQLWLGNACLNPK